MTFYEWLQQNHPQSLIDGDTGETLRPDQVEGNRRFSELQDTFRTFQSDEISRLYPDIQGPGGQTYSASLQTTDQGRVPSTQEELALSPYANTAITGPGGAIYMPKSILESPEVTSNNPSDMFQGLADRGVPVFALMSALGAFGAFGPQGFAGNLFGSPAGPTFGPGGEITNFSLGNAPGVNLPGSHFLQTGLEGGGLDFAGSLGEVVNPFGAVETGLGNWSVGTTGLLGMTPAEMAAIGGAFPMTAGLGAAGMGAASAGGLGGAGGFADWLTQGLQGLPPGSTTVASQLLKAFQGGSGPVKEDFNLLDPSTYGGSSAGGGLLDLLKGAGSGLSSLFPNANLGSLLAGLGQGALGYLGAKQQTDAMKEMQDKWLALGAPSRARFEGSFAPGFDIFQEPGLRGAAQGAADAAARSYSATSGNPFDQPSAQGGIYDTVLRGVAVPQLNTYRSQNLTGGQLGTNQAGTAGLQGAQLAGSGLDAIGAGLSTAINPPLTLNNSLAGLLNNYKLSY